MPDRPVIVIKLGSNALLDRQGRLDLAFLDAIGAQLARVRDRVRPVLVSSGAVACGVATLALAQRPAGMPERQALAAIGQAGLMHRWQVALAAHGLVGAQILLTADDFQHRQRYLNLTATFRACFAWDVVPVINENDTISTAELALGDNDRLSGLVAAQLGARQLVLLTDIDGVYDADPRGNPHARLLSEIANVTATHLGAAGEAGSVGRGGMRSKLTAAKLAAGAGVNAHICHAREPRVIERLVAGESVGTRIPARIAAHPASSRQRWLALARGIKGRLIVDAGAAAALSAQGRSLLPAGIAEVDGHFERGDTVSVCTADGDELGRGLASLSSTELLAVRGLRLDAAARRLGYALPKAAVHRDNLLILSGASSRETESPVAAKKTSR